METPVKMTNSIALLDESDIVVGSRYRVVGGEWSSQPGGTAENTYLAEILAIRSNTQASEGKSLMSTSTDSISALTNGSASIALFQNMNMQIKPVSRHLHLEVVAALEADTNGQGSIVQETSIR